MAEMDFKPNSHKYREEQKEKSTPERQRMEKIVQGTVKTKKKSEISKLKGSLIAEDAATIKSYLVTDVLLPALKNTIEDLVTNGIRMLLRGDTAARKSSGGSSKISYNRMYDRRDDRPSTNYRSRNVYDYDDIILETRGEAEAVIDRLCEAIDTYGQASVGDLNDLVGRTGNYTDNDYGWTNLRSARAVRTRDGYVLDLPDVRPLPR